MGLVPLQEEEVARDLSLFLSVKKKRQPSANQVEDSCHIC